MARINPYNNSVLFKLSFWISLPSVCLHFSSHLIHFSRITQSMIVVVWCRPSPPLRKNLGWPSGAGNISQRHTLCVQQTPSAVLGMRPSRGSVCSPTGRFMRCLRSLSGSTDSDMTERSLRRVPRCKCVSLTANTFYTISDMVACDVSRWRVEKLASFSVISFHRGIVSEYRVVLGPLNH